jgi:hypothetical protein
VTEGGFVWMIFTLAIVADACSGGLLGTGQIMTETPTIALAIGPAVLLGYKFLVRPPYGSERREDRRYR